MWVSSEGVRGSQALLNSEYLKAAWPDFWGCAFEVWPAPGPGKALKNVGGHPPPRRQGSSSPLPLRRFA